MSEVHLRIANLFRLFSMFAVLGSVIYMYAYVSDKVDFLHTSYDWYDRLSKIHIFYGSLGIFAIFNVLMSIAISMYKNVEGVDANFSLFKNETQKKRLLVRFTYFQGGVNYFIASMVLYLALLKINQAQSHYSYIYLPLIGISILTVILLGLVFQMIRK